MHYFQEKQQGSCSCQAVLVNSYFMVSKRVLKTLKIYLKQSLSGTLYACLEFIIILSTSYLLSNCHRRGSQSIYRPIKGLCFHHFLFFFFVSFSISVTFLVWTNYVWVWIFCHLSVSSTTPLQSSGGSDDSNNKLINPLSFLFEMSHKGTFSYIDAYMNVRVCWEQKRVIFLSPRQIKWTAAQTVCFVKKDLALTTFKHVLMG